MIDLIPAIDMCKAYKGRLLTKESVQRQPRGHSTGVCQHGV